MIRLCQWDITGNCNLHCVYCREKITKNLPDTPLDQMKHFVDQFTEARVENVTLAGGEPLLHPEVREIVTYLRDKVKHITVVTNATLIDEGWARFFKRHNCTMQISLDGSRAEIHDQMRGRGNFERTVAGIEILKKHDLHVILRLTICPQNLRDTADFVKLAHKLGAEGAFLRRVIPTGDYNRRHLLTSDELYSALKAAFEEGKRLGIKVGSADFFCQLTFSEEDIAEAEKNLTKYPGDQILSGCSIGRDTFFLAQDGRVLFCPYLPIYCGDLKEERLEDILKNSEMMTIARNLRFRVKGKCARCKYLRCCGGCPAYVFQTTGDIFASDNGCWMNP